ncbi:ATP-dependent DNA helicase DinG [Alteromonadales bacterium alter-6D02]|nr:ATP-dependent DNA helicase DinG [Alteromonadales bacterium alter-6D02]
MLSPQLQQTIKNCFKQFKQEIPNFVTRREQNYMVAQTAKILAGEYDRTRRIGVIEAGTGTGKSLAYCLGAIPVALSQGKKLCISTATVALQEQLLNKDLPLFRQYSRLEFDFAVVKGRQRYICASKLELVADAQSSDDNALWHQAPSKDDLTLVKKLWQAWLDKEWDGERDSWPTPISPLLWAQIQCDKFTCNKQLSAHRQCPFHKAREVIDKLDVLIVNHSLLLADLELGGGKILPEPADMFYVIDEAHHLPEKTRDFSSAFSSLQATIDWLKKMDLLGKKISSTLNSQQLISPLMSLSDHCNELSSDLTLVSQWLNVNSQLFANDDMRHRFEHGVLPDSLLALIENNAISSKAALKQLNKVHQIILEAYKDGLISPWKIEAVLSDIGNNLNRMENQQKLWHMLKRQDSKHGAPTVRWVELTDRERGEYLIHAAPLDIGYFLEDKLWSQAQGVILCSATVTALNSFDHFRRSVGLQTNDGTQYVRLNSPFNFKDNAKLIIPALQIEPSNDKFTEELIKRLPALIDNKQANLVLFSSYRQMNQVAKALRDRHQLSLLVQGEASRNALLTLHKDKCDNQQQSILFGTSSFSEGLDLPGKYLTNLVITKLPFAVPTSPIEQALAEYVKSKNGNPFMTLTVPDASRKLIQSCGRLLRNEQDSGTITILDRRLVTKRYGQSLLDSLPPYDLTIEH